MENMKNPKNSKPNRESRRTKSKSRKPFRKDADDKFDKDKFVAGRDNDPEWYTVAGQLTKDVSSISFNTAVGVPISLQADFSPALTPLHLNAVPGIMAIKTAPAVGIAPDFNPGSTCVNIAAANLYSWIRHANSGHSNYDPADLMIYLLAMDSLYSMYAWMTRIYGVARAFSQTNRYIGDALLWAMGVNPQDVRANLADFRMYINMFVTKVSAFCVPLTMSLYKRHVWMYSKVYKDEDVDKSQMYMYVPQYLWKFGLDAQGAGKLSRIDITGSYDSSTGVFTSASVGVDWIRTAAEQMISALVADEDCAIISGDILKAYGREKLWSINPIPEDHFVFPEFSEEVLLQFHNTRFVGHRPLNSDYSAGTSSLDLIQDPSINKGNIIYIPKFTGVSTLGYDAILDTWHQVPTPEDVVVGSRNIVHAQIVNETVGSTTVPVEHIKSCGSDLCLYADVWFYNDSYALDHYKAYYADGWQTGLLNRISLTSKFNEYPHFLAYANDNVYDVFGEISNYAILSTYDLAKLHDTAVLSMLAVPYLGDAVR